MLNRFLEKLPYFILKELFSFLEITELKELRLVCKRWNILVTPIALRVSTFSLEPAGRQSVTTFYEHFGRYVTALDFSKPLQNPHELDNYSIDFISRTCSKIRSLRIHIPEDWIPSSRFILSLAKSQVSFVHLSLLGMIRADFLVKISPVLNGLESLELDKLGFDFLQIPLTEHILCPKLKILTLWWHLFEEEGLVDVLNNRFSALKLINYIQHCSGSDLNFFCIKPDSSRFKAFRTSYQSEGIEAYIELFDFTKNNSRTPRIQVPPPKSINGSQNHIVRQIEIIDEFFFSWSVSSNFEQQFPYLRRVKLSIKNMLASEFIVLLTQLKGAETIILEVDLIDMVVEFPPTNFRAKTLSILTSKPFPCTYLSWVSDRFSLLEELYSYSFLSDEDISLVKHFNSLVRFYSKKSLPLSLLCRLSSVSL